MEKENLTQYSDEELSLRVQNDEPLYRMYMRDVKRNDFNALMCELDDIFIFTDAQKKDMEDTFSAEVEEYENENE
jgi:hypothetical protein